MNDIFLYLLKVMAGTAAFYFIYYAFLKNETYFKLNRFFLVLSPVFSFLLPLFQFSNQAIQLPLSFSETLNTVSVFSNQPVIPQYSINLSTIVLVIYLSITAILIIRSLLKIIHLSSNFLNKADIIRNENYKLIKTNKDISPCSFFNYIIIPNSLFDSTDLTKILTHEKVHVNQLHSIDTLIIELIAAILWFNPFTWKIKTAIKNTHEYLADEGVVEQGFDTTGYRLLLLEHAVGFKLGLANNLNQSITLKRMLMLNKSKSNWKAKLKVLSIVPVLFLLITLFKCKPETTTNGNETISKTVPSKEITQQPSFHGGQEAMVNFLIKNIKYPAEAKEKGIEGKVFVNFVVKKDGSIADVSVEKPINPLLDEEAIRVIKSMPNWAPGKSGDSPEDVQITLPINFRLK
jgi:TonB family protein